MKNFLKGARIVAALPLGVDAWVLRIAEVLKKSGE